MLFVILASVLVAGALASSGALDYDNQGGWPELCLIGTQQSPINIVSPKKVDKVSDPLIDIRGEADDLKMVNLNNLNTIKYEISPSLDVCVPFKKIAGSSDCQMAKTSQLHIHWGRNDDEGSEHFLNGVQYSAECHLVTSYTDSDGITKYAVFARFFIAGKENKQVQQMIEAAEEEGEDRDIDSFDLTKLYPENTKEILTYEGSFTTPECDELAYWVVIPKPLEISSEQLEALRELSLGDGSAHEKPYNFRGLQNLNGREIKRYRYKKGKLTSD